MPKHKKFLKSEKSKVKLKDYKLPKGLNVTKTDFKVKKIVINEQLRNTYNADGTVIRKENIKDLLSKLQHHNTSYRTEGLRYLKDILTHNAAEVSQHFGSIVQGVAQLCLDVEKDVRHESFKSLSLLLSSTTSDTVVPFFDTIASYLRCAMTHINVNIQEDSLEMLNTLLTYVPELVAENSNKILMAFLDMISKQSESKSERSLTVNLSSTLTSVKWRSIVLERLRKTLCKMVEAKRKGKKIVNDNEAVGTLTLKSESKASGFQTVYYSDTTPMHFSIVRSHLNRNCVLHALFNKKSRTSNPQDMDEQESIHRYAELLLPLIMGTWLEVRPTVSKSDISYEAAVTLKILLEIVDKIHELVVLWGKEHNNDSLMLWFREHWNREFCSNFVEAFPYTQNEVSSSSKRKSSSAPSGQDFSDSGGPECDIQNLNIAYLFCCFNRELYGKKPIDHAQQVINFLNRNLSNYEDSFSNANLLVTIMREILLENGDNWSKKLPVRRFLCSVIQTYQDNKFSRKIKSKVLFLLCDVALDWKLYKTYGESSFSAWLPTLPGMLCQPYISKSVLLTFLVLAKQKNELFLSNLEHLVPNILANLSTIQVSGVDDPFEGRRMVVDLLFWVKELDINQDPSLSKNCPKIYKCLQQIRKLKEQYMPNELPEDDESIDLL